MNKEFLNKLDGENHLLTQFQLKYLKDVVSVIEEKILNGVDLIQEEEKNLQVAKELAIITEKLSVIIDRLKDGPNAKKEFYENYPKFEEVRKNCNHECRAIAKYMQNDRFNFNVLKLVGYGTSLLGGGLCVASTFAIPFTFGLSSPLAVGGSMLAAGGVTILGTSVTESVRLNSQVKRVQKIINEDKEYLKKLNFSLKHASDLEEALAEILEIDIVKDISKSAKRLIEKGMEIKKHSDRLIFLEEHLKQVMKHPHKNWEMAETATVILSLVVLFVLLRETKNRLVFDFAALIIKSFAGIIQLADDALDVQQLLRIFKIKAVINKAIVHRVIAGIGIALDAVGIALTSIDIHKGSCSQEAKKILNLVVEMEKEAINFKNVYENIN